MTRINIDMTFREMCVAMADTKGSGINPGALTGCLEIVSKGASVDPDDFMKGVSAILLFDEMEIHDTKFYLLWNDVCGRSVTNVIALARAYQLGQLAGVTKEAILHAIDNRGAGLDFPQILAAVKRKLPKFNDVLTF